MLPAPLCSSCTVKGSQDWRECRERLCKLCPAYYGSVKGTCACTEDCALSCLLCASAQCTLSGLSPWLPAVTQSSSVLRLQRTAALNLVILYRPPEYCELQPVYPGSLRVGPEEAWCLAGKSSMDPAFRKRVWAWSWACS